MRAFVRACVRVFRFKTNHKSKDLRRSLNVVMLVDLLHFAVATPFPFDASERPNRRLTELRFAVGHENEIPDCESYIIHATLRLTKCNLTCSSNARIDVDFIKFTLIASKASFVGHSMSALSRI